MQNCRAHVYAHEHVRLLGTLARLKLDKHPPQSLPSERAPQYILPVVLVSSAAYTFTYSAISSWSTPLTALQGAELAEYNLQRTLARAIRAELAWLVFARPSAPGTLGTTESISTCAHQAWQSQIIWSFECKGEPLHQ